MSGFFVWFASVWWIKNQLVDMVQLPTWQAWGWTVVFCALNALPYAFFGYLAGKFRLMESHSGTVVAAVALVVMQAWFPHVFPGSEVNFLYSWPLFIQVLDLGGTPLLLFCIYLVNFQIVRVFTARRSQESWVPAVMSIVVVFVFLAGYGGWRLHDLHRQMETATSGQRISVLAIQPNVPITASRSGASPGEWENNMKAVLALSIEASRRVPGAELLVWPELPLTVNCQAAVRDLPLLAQLTGKALLVPCVSVIGDNGRTAYNSVTFINKDGGVGEEYRKLILVPFGEYIPLERQFPLLRKLFPGVMAFVVGNTEAVVHDFGEERRLIPSLCYEATFTGHIRRFVERGGNVLINMGDDAWFGKSQASVMHLSLALYRSVEYRIPFIRVANSGVGVFVQPTGEIVPGSQTPLFQKAVTANTLYIPAERSFYSRFGDVFLYGLTAFFVLKFGCYLRQRQKLAGENAGDKNKTPNMRRA